MAPVKHGSRPRARGKYAPAFAKAPQPDHDDRSDRSDPSDHELGTAYPAHRSDRALGWLLLVGGVVGAISALLLLIERLELIADPDYVPSCSINPVLNCGSVMSTDQASLLGFPNPIIGVALLPIAATTGAALLAGARLARWYWLALQVGVAGALAFVAWLAFQSLYRIGALCPYCMVVWACVVPMTIYVTGRNLLAGVLGSRVARHGTVQAIARWHGLILTVIGLILLALILERFWSYWTTLL